jgi:hypothetical protein
MARLIGGKINNHWLPCREKAPNIEQSAFALPIPKHEATLGVTSHRCVLESVVIEATLIGSRNRPDGPLADVVPAISVHAVDCYATVTLLCKVCLDRSIAAVGVTDYHSMVALDNIV